MTASKSKRAFFIIESLQFKDEKSDLYEGSTIATILRLNGVENKYYYIRTMKELIKVLKLFKTSNYRYLHISCHGANGGIALSLDTISYDKLGAIMNRYLKDKRVFLSACSSVNDEIATALIPDGQPYSLIGPTKDVEFRDATIFWASFYHLMAKANEAVMLRDDLIENIQKVVNTFQIPITYYSRNSKVEFKKKLFKVQKTMTTTTEKNQLK